MANDISIGVAVNPEPARRGAEVVRASLAEIALQSKRTADLIEQGQRKAAESLKRTGREAELSGGSMRRMGGEAAQMARQLLLVAGAAIAMRQVFQATIEQERAMVQLNVAVRNAGTAFKGSAKEMVDFAEEMQRVSAFSDDAVMATQAMFLSLGVHGRETIPRATKAAADLASMFGGDLSSASFTLAKALTDPEQGIAMLNRQLKLFTKDEADAIKAMADQGHVAEATEIILGRVESRVGGLSDELRHTLGGALAATKNAFGDLLEGDGGVNELRDAIDDLGDVARDPAVKEGFQLFTAAMLTAFGGAAKAAAGLVISVKEMAEELAAMSSNYKTAQDYAMEGRFLKRAAKMTAMLIPPLAPLVPVFNQWGPQGDQGEKPQQDPAEVEGMAEATREWAAATKELTDAEQQRAAVMLANKMEELASIEAKKKAAEAERELKAARQEHMQAVEKAETAAKAELDARLEANEAMKQLTVYLRPASAGLISYDAHLTKTANTLTAMGVPLDEFMSTMRESALVFGRNVIPEFEKSARTFDDFQGAVSVLSEQFDTGLISLDDYLARVDVLKELFANVGTEAPEAIDTVKESFEALRDTMVDLSSEFGRAAAQFTAGFEKVFEMVKNEGNLSAEQLALGYAGAFGQMAAGAAGFFDEQSTGYKVLSTASKVFHAAELAMTVAELVPKAIAAVLNQANGEPYTAWGRMAAMVAFVGSLGVSLGGGGGGGGGASKPAPPTGAGTVLGDPMAQSDSIQNSLDRLIDIADLSLQESARMLKAMESVDQGIRGLAIVIGRDLGQGGGGQLFTGHIFDMMLRFNEQTVGAMLAAGAAQGQYRGAGFEHQMAPGATIEAEGGLGTALVTAPLGEQLGREIALVVRGLTDAATIAAVSLGADADAIRGVIATLDSGLSDLGHLQDVTNEELEELLNAVFSNLGDRMAEVVLPGIRRFQQSGEGLLDTLIRVATGVEFATVTLGDLGIAAVPLAAVSGTVADVGAELIRLSVVAAESTRVFMPFVGEITVATTGLGELVQGFHGSAEEMASFVTSLYELRDAMNNVGVDGQQLTRTMIEAAGGISELGEGLEIYAEQFFTPAEQLAKLTGDTASALKEVGIALPATREGLRELVEGLDLTTEAGQRQFGTIMSLAGQLDQIFDAAEVTSQESADGIIANLEEIISGAEREFQTAVRTFEDGMRSAAQAFEQAMQDIANAREGLASARQSIISSAPGYDASSAASARIRELRGSLGTGSIQDQIGAVNGIRDAVLARYQAEVASIQAAQQAAQAHWQEQQAAAESLRAALEDLRRYAESLRLSELSPLTNPERLRAARGQYGEALLRAQSGDAGDVAALQGAAGAYLGEARGFYASSPQYTAIFDAVQAELERVSGRAAGGGSEFPNTGHFDAQIARAQEAALRELDSLETTLTALEKQASDELLRNTENLRLQFEADTQRVIDTIEEASKAAADQVSAQVAKLISASLQAASDSVHAIRDTEGATYDVGRDIVSKLQELLDEQKGTNTQKVA